MRFEYLTPHQFSSLQPFVDTLLVSTFTPTSLDIALPQAASMFIVDEIHKRVKHRLMGRVAEVRLGAALFQSGLHEEWFRAVGESCEHSVANGVVIVDRTLLREQCDFGVMHGTHWFVADWWQWLRAHVPAHRMTDAIMYLCLTNQLYLASGEFRQLGLPTDVCNDMKQEGARIADKYVEWLCEQIVTMWSTTSSQVT